jgi:hypothetical protein
MLYQNKYSIRFILLDSNIDVSRHILTVDTSILVANNMDRREYNIIFHDWTNDADLVLQMLRSFS